MSELVTASASSLMQRYAVACSCSRICPTRILAPLPTPRWSRARRQARDRLRQLAAQAAAASTAATCSTRIVADLKAQAPDHIAVTGDLVNISLAGEFAPARAWLDALGSPHDVTVVPGNHDAYVRGAARHPQLALGRLHARRRCGDAARFRSCAGAAPLALIGLSSAVPTPPFMATGRLGGEQLARLARAARALRPRRAVSRGADPSSAGEQAGRRIQAAGRRRRRCARCWRGTAPSWCCTATITCTR